MIFASNSTLDDKYQLLPYIPGVSEQYVSIIFITSCEVSKHISYIDLKKATDADKIPVVVFMYINPELFPSLSNFINRCLKEKYFPSACPIFNEINKFLYAMINKTFVHFINRDKLLSDKQYEFRLSPSTTDIPTTITHRIHFGDDRIKCCKYLWQGVE